MNLYNLNTWNHLIEILFSKIAILFHFFTDLLDFKQITVVC